MREEYTDSRQSVKSFLGTDNLSQDGSSTLRASAHRAGPQNYTLPSDVGMMYVRAWQRDQALAWLEKAFEMRDPNLPLVHVHPIFGCLRSDPRFQDLVRRMNFPL
jgi:hypothetical protein